MHNVLPGSYSVVVSRIFTVSEPMSDFVKVCRSFGRDPYKVNIEINIPRITTKENFQGHSVDIVIDIDEVFGKYKK
ncbi:MAG: hypothetical protein PHW42_01225 [Patescibacteria group bacterium]|nr:hypothetical protein [Patescibacteria group bacterium]